MILLLMSKAEAPVLLVARAARWIRNVRRAPGARAGAIAPGAGIHWIAR